MRTQVLNYFYIQRVEPPKFIQFNIKTAFRLKFFLLGFVSKIFDRSEDQLYQIRAFHTTFRFEGMAI